VEYMLISRRQPCKTISIIPCRQVDIVFNSSGPDMYHELSMETISVFLLWEI
jgi:hypothetical protein